MSRFRWEKPSTLPERVELIDSVSGQRVAVVLTLEHGFQWKRETSVMMHGAAAAEGDCRSFAMAKRQVVEGLPDAPELR